MLRLPFKQHGSIICSACKRNEDMVTHHQSPPRCSLHGACRDVHFTCRPLTKFAQVCALTWSRSSRCLRSPALGECRTSPHRHTKTSSGVERAQRVSCMLPEAQGTLWPSLPLLTAPTQNLELGIERLCTVQEHFQTNLSKLADKRGLLRGHRTLRNFITFCAASDQVLPRT
jgi:hypothetical protein